MKHEKLLKLYIRLLGGPLDFHGIKLIPSLSEDSRTIKWKLENLNDISFNSNAIKQFIWDSYYHFISITVGYSDKSWMGFKNNYTPHLDMSDIPKYYLNQEIKNSIEAAAKNCKKVQSSSIDATFHINVLKYWISFKYHQEISIEAKIDVLKVVGEDGSEYTNEQIKSAFNHLEDLDEMPEFTDKALDKIGNVIWDSPTLCDRDTNYIESSAIFYDLNGKTLNS